MWPRVCEGPVLQLSGSQLCAQEGKVEEAAVGDKASVPHPSTHTYTHTRTHRRARTTVQAVKGEQQGQVKYHTRRR